MILILSLVASVVQLCLIAAELLLEILFDIYFSCYRKMWSNFEICWPITVHYMHCFRILYSMIICWSIKYLLIYISHVKGSFPFKHMILIYCVGVHAFGSCGLFVHWFVRT